MKAVRVLLNDLADIQARRKQVADAINAGDHNDCSLDEALKDDIADLLIDSAEALAASLNRADLLAAHLDDFESAAECGADEDSHVEAIRLAARDLLNAASGAAAPATADDSTTLTELRKAHAHALQAADGDSNDDEIAAWRETAELATALLPGYTEPTITD